MLLSRNGWTLATIAALSAWFLGPDAKSAFEAVVGPEFPLALLGLASLLQLAISSWVLVIIGLAQLRGTSRIARAITPELVRRALFVSAAGALALSPAQDDRGSSPTHANAQQHSLDGLRLPDRPTTIERVAAVERAVIVQPGDTLWAIAARSLPPVASNTEIARACAQWYAANRGVIGDNPDLIQPSQHLITPALTSPTKDAS